MAVNKIQIFAYAHVAFHSNSHMVSFISFYGVLLQFPSPISYIPNINFLKRVFKSG